MHRLFKNLKCCKACSIWLLQAKYIFFGNCHERTIRRMRTSHVQSIPVGIRPSWDDVPVGIHPNWDSSQLGLPNWDGSDVPIGTIFLNQKISLIDVLPYEFLSRVQALFPSPITYIFCRHWNKAKSEKCGGPHSLIYPRRRTHSWSMQHPGLMRELGGILTVI